MRRIRWAESARRDFLTICDWIEERNPAATGPIGRRLLDAVERLGVMPLLGRAGRVSGTRELVVPGLPYVVVYLLEGDDLDGVVAILRIIHGAMRWPSE